MRITGLNVDGFGVWTGLKLEGLNEGLNVLFGPNEAGKTTLLQFVRSALYGFSPERRKYLPPVHGGRPGGTLEVAGPNGAFRLDRHQDEDNGSERLLITAADGTRQGEHFVKILLCDIDEPIFNNVFAVSLREMQELATLSGTDAARLLYSLTAGLDRVSLVDVMRELENSRNRILDIDGGKCRIVELLNQREELLGEIEELGKLTRRYGRLAADRDQLQREIIGLEEDNTQTEHEARTIELAVSLRERWQRRAELDHELAAMGPRRAMPEGAVEQLNRINGRLQQHQQRIQQIGEQRQGLRDEAAQLKVNESLRRRAVRIEGLKEQEPWILQLQDQIGALETEIGSLESGLTEEGQRLGWDTLAKDAVPPELSPRTISKLRSPARQWKQSRLLLERAQKEQATAADIAKSLSEQIAAALSARGKSDLADATGQAGDLTARLRRRVQIDERLEQLDRNHVELEQQVRRLLDRQVLPIWVVLGLGGVFVLGAMMVLVGLMLPSLVSGTLAWALTLLGLIGAGGAGALKFLMERSNARKLDASQKQLAILQTQIHQARDERDLLDRQLPRGGGPLAVRLQTAEHELAELEELAPLDTRRSAARQEMAAAAERVQRNEAELATARRAWREALAAAGLPRSLTPKHVRQLLNRCDQIGQLRRKLTDRREELTRRRRELELIINQIVQLASDSDLPADGSPIEQLGRLAEELAEQEARVERRETLRRHSRQLRRKLAKHEEALARMKHLRRELLRNADAEDEQAFRQRALQAARAEVLLGERDTLARDIASAIGDSCSEESIARQLRDDVVESLSSRFEERLERMTVLDGQLEERFEKRGQLNEQLRTLAEDRRLADKQLELATVDQRTRDAIARWQVLAVTGRTLQAIRTIYEEQRQPETLQEASGYLDRLTRNRYRRVWTPLGEDILLVDDAQGNALPVESLSRGTREQLFLALRLALAACYARRGSPLPLILDDVLVNFDTDRAKAAAAVLRDFAAEGHQLLVFTCHEHILKLFKTLKVPVNRLPDNTKANPAPIVFESAVAKKSKKPRKSKKPLPEETVADEADDDQITVIEPTETEVFAPSEEEEIEEEEIDEEEPEDEYEEDLEEDEEEEEEEDEFEDEYDEDEGDEDDMAEAA